MKPILIIKNITREGPGLLSAALVEAGLTAEVIDLSAGQKIPSELQAYQGLVVLGGPMSVNDGTAHMRSLLHLIEHALQHQWPYLGICLGMQALVKAGGGRVVACPRKEIGFLDPEGQPFTIELNSAGQHDLLFKDLESSLRVFHLHGETVELGPDMTLLAEGRWCRHQAVRIKDHAWGLQCHFELTAAMLQNWISEDPDLQAMDPAALRQLFADMERDYTRTGRTLLRNFLATVIQSAE
ncbi:MAG: type 1 glutamine amidotransferase [Leptospiraceae bacterium]|nr:type 1 glutamine amidotransferase [Leptospiraceae bacterium]